MCSVCLSPGFMFYDRDIVTPRGGLVCICVNACVAMEKCVSGVSLSVTSLQIQHFHLWHGSPPGMKTDT